MGEAALQSAKVKPFGVLKVTAPIDLASRPVDLAAGALALLAWQERDRVRAMRLHRHRYQRRRDPDRG